MVLKDSYLDCFLLIKYRSGIENGKWDNRKLNN